jgi:hypothetical protein
MYQKWLSWEYWPTWLATPPVVAIYLWFALRARHLVFFSNVNPAIPLGGVVGESKRAILDLIPGEYIPRTVFIPAGSSRERVLSGLEEKGLHFPLVVKPDIGERGFLIKKVSDFESLYAHIDRNPVDFLVQEFLEEPMEATVLFYRFPDGRFGITSVCIKEFLSVTGDGVSSIEELMEQDFRARLQLDRFRKDAPALMTRVPAPEEKILLEPIGNHARGTKFINGARLITPDMTERFAVICRWIDGVLYGRFDLKTASPEALQRGEFKVMELNGITSDPAHVYDPAHGMWRAYRDYYRHWRIIYQLHKAQRVVGIMPATHREAWRFFRNYFRYKKQVMARIG